MIRASANVGGTFGEAWNVAVSAARGRVSRPATVGVLVTLEIRTVAGPARTRSLDPTGVGRARWMMRWKPALNAFAITFGDRCPAAETY
jgi:hypothetical protein